MAIAYDSSALGAANTTSWSHTCSGSDRILIVSIANDGTSSSATYNGVAMTQQGSVVSDLTVWYLINPDTGTNTVSFTNSSGTKYRGASSSYTGVKQTGFPDSTANNATTTTPRTLSTTVVASNCWLVNCGMGRDTSLNSTISTDRTDRQTGQTSNAEYSVLIGDSNGTVGTGAQSTTFTAAGSGTPTLRGVLTLSMAPVASAATGNFFMFI